MKLKDLYGTIPPTMTTIDFGEIAFKAAYPENIEKETKRLRRLSEDLFETFYKDWENRYRAAIKKELGEGSSPHTIVKLVPYMTSDEYLDILRLTDEFIPDTEIGRTMPIDSKPADTLIHQSVTFQGFAKFALKIREIESHVMSLLQNAQGIFKEEYQTFQEEQSKRKIITRTGPPIIQADR